MMIRINLLPVKAAKKRELGRQFVVVAAGLALAARPTTPGDDHSGICVGSMQIVACVPPDGT